MTRLFVAVVLTTRAVRRPLNLAVGCPQMDGWSPKTRPRTWTGALKVLRASLLWSAGRVNRSPNRSKVCDRWSASRPK